MALVLKDRVKETTTVLGTGTAELSGAPAGFQPFSVIGDGNTTYYCISAQNGVEWEIGIGTYLLGSNVLTRTTILSSSNSGSIVNFNEGTKDVFITYPAEKGIWFNASGNAIGLGTPASITLTNATGLPNSGLVNDSVTVNGSVITLGGSGTITTTTPNALTIGTGLSGTSFNGSSAVTIANTGVLSNVAGTGISVSGTTGNVTITNSAPMTYASAGIAVSTGSAWGTSLTAPSGGIVGTSDTQTLTNKRITARVISITGSAGGAITPTSDTADQYNITALGASCSFSAPSGTPTDGQRLNIRIYSAAAQTISSWASSSGGYRAIGVTLPTASGVGKTIYVGCVYNVADTIWDVVAVATQA
jgi:hypothetical protein